MTSIRLDVARAIASPPEDIVAGLTEEPRSIPCKYFYDDRGAALFEQICRLPEYYPTRTEIDILSRNIGSISSWVGSRARVIEYGSGSGEKTRLLLDGLRDPHEYIPIDICLPQLVRNAAQVRREFSRLRVTPLHGDYTQRLRLPAAPNGWSGRSVVFFPGSTIGNFEPLAAVAFLQRVADVAGPAGGLLIGVDLKKAVAILERAYNDAAGITAAFNLNILAHVNRLCGSDFNPALFEHVAFYDGKSRVEMHLRSRVDQSVTLRDATEGPTVLRLEQGELLGTEHCYKYDDDEFRDLVSQAGFSFRRRWIDPRQWFGVYAFDVDA
jgi:dimethylhistidine N-methyltransferase